MKKCRSTLQSPFWLSLSGLATDLCAFMTLCRATLVPVAGERDWDEWKNVRVWQEESADLLANR